LGTQTKKGCWLFCFFGVKVEGVEANKRYEDTGINSSGKSCEAIKLGLREEYNIKFEVKCSSCF
jgi:hypothetical protein